MKNKQLTFADAMAGFSRQKKTSKAVAMLAKIWEMVNWSGLALIVSVLDKTQSGKGGRP